MTGYHLVVTRPNAAPLTVAVPVVNCTGDACSYTIPNASVYDGEHSISVMAINSAGSSAPSAVAAATASSGAGTASATCSAYTYPGMITNLNATVNNSMLNVSWANPALVTYVNPSTGAQSQQGTTTTLLVKPPVGPAYLLTAVAGATTISSTINYPGDYSVSAYATKCRNSDITEEEQVTLQLPASPGQNPVGGAVSGKVSITWEPSNLALSNSSVGGYTITVIPPKGLPVVIDVPGSASTTIPGASAPSTSVPGEYQYSIVAYSGAKKANSEPVTGQFAAGIPEAPILGSLEINNGVVSVTWSSAPENTEIPITGYQVTLYTPGGTSASAGNPYGVVTRTVSSTGTPTGNTAGNTLSRVAGSYSWVYTSSVANTAGDYRAVISATTGSAGSTYLGVPLVVTASSDGTSSSSRPPSAPRGAQASVSAGVVTVSWSTPADLGTHQINWYALTLVSPAGVSKVTLIPVAGSANPSLDDTASATAQSDGSVLYEYHKSVSSAGDYSGNVVAYSSVSQVSPPAAFSTNAALPPAPAAVLPGISVTDGRVAVSWQTSPVLGASPVISYDLVLHTPSGVPIVDNIQVSENTAGSKSATYVVVNPTNDIRKHTWLFDATAPGEYYAEVRTVTAAGVSIGAFVTEKAHVGVPPKVSDIQVTYSTPGVSGGLLQATWTPAVLAGIAPATEYEVTWYKPNATSGSPSSVVHTATGLTDSITATQNGIYTVAIRARNSSGYSLPVTKNLELNAFALAPQTQGGLLLSTIPSDGAMLQQGTTQDLTLKIINPDQVPSSPVTYSIVIPQGIDPTGWTSSTNCEVTGQRVRCRVSSLAAGAIKDIQIKVAVSLDLEDGLYAAEVEDYGFLQIEVGSRHSEVSEMLLELADTLPASLEFSTSLQSGLRGGDTSLMEVQVTNNSSNIVPSSVVRIDVPSGINFEATLEGGYECLIDRGDRVGACNLRRMLPQTSYTITIDVSTNPDQMEDEEFLASFSTNTSTVVSIPVPVGKNLYQEQFDRTGTTVINNDETDFYFYSFSPAGAGAALEFMTTDIGAMKACGLASSSAAFLESVGIFQGEDENWYIKTVSGTLNEADWLEVGNVSVGLSSATVESILTAYGDVKAASAAASTSEARMALWLSRGKILAERLKAAGLVLMSADAIKDILNVDSWKSSCALAVDFAAGAAVIFGGLAGAFATVAFDITMMAVDELLTGRTETALAAALSGKCFSTRGHLGGTTIWNPGEYMTPDEPAVRVNYTTRRVLCQ